MTKPILTFKVTLSSAAVNRARVYMISILRGNIRCLNVTYSYKYAQFEQNRWDSGAAEEKICEICGSPLTFITPCFAPLHAHY